MVPPQSGACPRDLATSRSGWPWPITRQHPGPWVPQATGQGVPPLLRAHHKHQQCPQLLMGTPRDSRDPRPPTSPRRWTHLSAEVSHEVTAPDPAGPWHPGFQLVTGSHPSAPQAHNASSVPRELPDICSLFFTFQVAGPSSVYPSPARPSRPSVQALAFGLLPGTWTLKWGSLTDAPQLPLGNV